MEMLLESLCSPTSLTCPLAHRRRPLLSTLPHSVINKQSSHHDPALRIAQRTFRFGSLPSRSAKERQR